MYEKIQSIVHTFFLLFFFMFDLDFTDTHNLTLQYHRASYQPKQCALELLPKDFTGDLWRSAQPRHTFAALITLLLISPTSEEWKAESTLPPPGYECIYMREYRQSIVYKCEGTDIQLYISARVMIINYI